MRKQMHIRIVSIALVIALVVLSVPVCVSAKTDEGKQWLSFYELCRQKGFVNGIQHPYMDKKSIGNDWGHSSLDNYNKCAFKEEDFLRVFHNCKAMGYDIYKTWLSYNCAGMIFDSNNDVVGIDPTYLENLPKVLQMAQDAGLYICLATFDHKEGYLANDTSSYKYERTTRYLHNETARNMLFENWLRPIIEVLKDYPNVVLIDLYVEAEADGGIWNVPNGTNWEKMREFIKAENDFIKGIYPGIETYCSATTEPDGLYENYSGLGLDYYAYDLYQSTGGATETTDLFLDVPFIYGEVGIKQGTAAKGEEFVSNWLGNYYSEAVSSGVKAGFYWSYGWGKEGNMTVVDGNGLPRSAMLTSRFFQLDRDYELAGISPDMDKPAMAYSTNESITWFGSRGASKYRVEKTTDLKNWTELVTVDPEVDKTAAYSTLLYQTKDTTPGLSGTFYYRAVAIDAEGNEAVSDPSNIVVVKQTTCDEADNLIKNYSFEDENGFSDNGRGEKWQVTSQNSANAAYNMVYYKDATEGDLSHTGTHSISKALRLKQYVSVKPNTDYTFTFFIRFDNVAGYWNHYVGVLTDVPDNVQVEAFNKDYLGVMDVIQVPDDVKDGKWHRITYFFNSGDYDEVCVQVQGYHTKADNPVWYVDDLYLFETK
ncbi:MAG: hypothetical protein J6T73_03655 [Clostridia bacterium]|nr:hypothetical protein [Clostridia bacterium]